MGPCDIWCATGAILGPLLLLLFINNMPDSAKKTILR